MKVSITILFYIPYIMSIFRLSRKMKIPHTGNAAFIAGESGRIFMEKLGIGFETCIVLSHVQIRPFRAMGNFA
jgi:hypothetical protein